MIRNKYLKNKNLLCVTLLFQKFKLKNVLIKSYEIVWKNI